MSRYISPDVRRDVFETYGFETGYGPCWCCQRTPLKLCDVDLGHIQAFSLGGPNTFENLRPICRACNNTGDKTENLLDRKMRTCEMHFIEQDQPYKGFTRRDFLELVKHNTRLPQDTLGTILEYVGRYANYNIRDEMYAEFQVQGYIKYTALKILGMHCEEQKRQLLEVQRAMANMSVNKQT